jgi:FG-GAP-like repeat
MHLSRRIRRVAALLGAGAALALLAAPPAMAGRPPIDFEHPTRMQLADVAIVSMVIADVTGDGKRDLVVATDDPAPATHGCLVVFPGTGGDRLGRRTRICMARTIDTMRAADFDGNGRADLYGIAGGQVFILMQGDSGLAAPRFLPAAWHPFGVAAGDMNRDGRADLVVARYEYRTVQGILIASLRDGRWRPRFFPKLRTPRDMALMDVNHDGRRDIVACGQNWSCGGFVIFVHGPHGTYAERDGRAADASGMRSRDSVRGVGVWAGRIVPNGYRDVYVTGGGLFRGTSGGSFAGPVHG